MPKPRKPTRVLELSGAFKKDPKRALNRVNEPTPAGDIGPAPDNLDSMVSAFYDEIVHECPKGVLKNSDRFAVISAARLMLKESLGTATASEIGHLKQYYQQFGMTPASRSLVSIDPDDVPNEFRDC